AIERCDAHVAQRIELFLEAADALIGVEQLIAHGKGRHHGEPCIADLAELAAQRFHPRFETFREPQQPRLLPFLTGHPVLPAVDGDVDVAHESSESCSSSTSSSANALSKPGDSSPASSTARMVPIAASSRSAISRLARSSRRDFTSDPSSSSARRDRSAPSAWIRLASSFSSRSASRRRSTALSSASIPPSLRMALTLLASKPPAAVVCSCGELPPTISFQTDFHHDAGRSYRYGQCDPWARHGRRREGEIRPSGPADGRRRYRDRVVHA